MCVLLLSVNTDTASIDCYMLSARITKRLPAGVFQVENWRGGMERDEVDPFQ